MSKEFTKEDVIQNKKEAIKSLNKMLEYFINDPTGHLLKKANLLSYWLKTFTNYIMFEETFSPDKLIRYERGNVIRVNMGFNVGKEIGGLHYAVVIDNDNKRNADVVTVIPLSSTDGKTVHERNVDLGSELYEKVSGKQHKLLETASKELEEIKFLNETIKSLIESINSNGNLEKINEQFSNIDNKQKAVQQRQSYLEKRISILKANNVEISKMKFGSMAVTNQIRTISKQRIYTPKKAEDFLHNVSLSPSAMDKITSKIKELFVFEK